MAEKTPSGAPRRLIRTTEPIARALAGRRWFPLWAVIRHRGRRSGTAYATPIAVVPTVAGDDFLIGLPWGATTNWARNIVAAGGATVRWKGGDHALTAPRIITGPEASALAKPAFRAVVARMPAAIVLKRG